MARSSKHRTHTHSHTHPPQWAQDSRLSKQGNLLRLRRERPRGQRPSIGKPAVSLLEARRGSRNKRIEVIQLNLNHCRAAQDLLLQTVRELKSDLAILSEPYKSGDNESWATDRTGKASLWACGGDPCKLSNVLAGDGFVRARAGNLWVYSCYLAPSLPLESFARIIEELAEDARNRGAVLIAGDFNAWAHEWGCRVTNARGRILLETLASLDLALLNEGSQQTFCRGSAGSIINLTFASPSQLRNARWRIGDVYTGSDHEDIVCTIGERPRPSRSSARSKAYIVDTLNTSALARSLETWEALGDTSANESANQLALRMEEACDRSMRQRKPFIRHHEPIVWWNADIDRLRTTCLRARRAESATHDSVRHIA
ncbi:uncharacterized protein LOC117193934 [Drosophila miranda]|uniref:uncharacterized protein LOC117193934 n=1 Tax=Drosophila miranda TaxID=7229 RepID=UPI00143FA13F|nr:uncharacterized protein LOC117193934 [Drosophila miranda]